MKKIVLMTCVSLFSVIGCAHANTAADEAPAATKKSPFYNMYPADLAPAAESYFGEWNKVLFKTGPIDGKSARLAAISASAAMCFGWDGVVVGWGGLWLALAYFSLTKLKAPCEDLLGL